MLFISLLIAPIVATQGAQRRLNIINEKAESLLPSKIKANVLSAFAIEEREPNTETTSSFAARPKIVATAACHLTGEKILFYLYYDKRRKLYGRKK